LIASPLKFVPNSPVIKYNELFKVFQISSTVVPKLNLKMISKKNILYYKAAGSLKQPWIHSVRPVKKSFSRRKKTQLSTTIYSVLCFDYSSLFPCKNLPNLQLNAIYYIIFYPLSQDKKLTSVLSINETNRIPRKGTENYPLNSDYHT